MYGMQYNEEVVGLPRKLFVEAMLAEDLSVRDGYLKPTYLEDLYQKQTFFGKEGFPFSFKKRKDDLNYNKGLCPVAESNQEKTMLLTAIMQPPQTIEDMDIWTEGAMKVIKNKDRLLKSLKK